MANLGEIIGRLRLEIEAMLRAYPDLADDEVARLDTLDGETDVREALISLARMLDDTNALQEGVHGRIAELKAREDRFSSRVEFLRDLMFKLMASANFKKLELPLVTLSLRNNPPALVGDADPATLPDELVRISRALDRRKIRETIEAGHDVPGFQLSNAAPSLVVKIK